MRRIPVSSSKPGSRALRTGFAAAHSAAVPPRSLMTVPAGMTAGALRAQSDTHERVRPAHLDPVPAFRTEVHEVEAPLRHPAGGAAAAVNGDRSILRPVDDHAFAFADPDAVRVPLADE